MLQTHETAHISLIIIRFVLAFAVNFTHNGGPIVSVHRVGIEPLFEVEWSDFLLGRLRESVLLQVNSKIQTKSKPATIDS